MATTITYKGSDLTSFSNTSKTLRTAGKYLEGDITVSSALNLQGKTTSITPNTSTQTTTIGPDSGYEGLSGVTITVNPIPSQYIIPAGTITITSNGTHDVSQYADAEVQINTVNNQNKTVVPSEASQSITADTGYTGLGTVTVNGITNTYVGSSVPTVNSSSITANYEANNDIIRIEVSKGYLANKATAGKQPKIILPTQSATTIIPSETDQTAVDIHKWTTGTVTVAAITPTYVGSEVPQRTNADLSLNTGSVIGPSGYYSSNLQKSFPVAGNAPQPTITVNSSGLITSKVTVPMDAWYQVSSATNTLQLPVQAATTITPSSATQTVTGQKYMTGDITVQPIPSQYIVPSGTLTITSVDTTTTFDVTSYANVAVNLKDADVTAY